MANIKSAKKRVVINENNRLRNQKYRSDMRSSIKRVEKAVRDNNVDQAKESLKTALSNIDKAVQKNIVHSNNGDRHKSKLMKKVNQL
ncbi:30S ribosomal protein S20 [Halalkalibacillus sediminis]|uniref:Small ribosomal subunit protein bS20 n=1 Tax=Halalkalibacillus sediminis TaxID=2018042 RepID=A0A2I0QXK5_9BACI|nr:30S ribosomal protein S20 [Halalkalibacillus sediminis]PKR79049.1 30S ribosomal protein S20 [Halalkalibacillus sediminis]